MVRDRSSRSNRGLTSGSVTGEGVLAIFVVIVVAIVVLRLLSGASQKFDPMADISLLEVRGLLNTTHSALMVDRTRLSEDPFSEKSEDRFSIRCRLRLKEFKRDSQGRKEIPIPSESLRFSSEKARDSFSIEPLSLTYAWAGGIQFRDIDEVSCSLVIPITGSSTAALIFTTDSLEYYIDAKTSQLNVKGKDRKTDEIVLPKGLALIFSGAYFDLLVRGDGQGRQYGKITAITTP